MSIKKYHPEAENHSRNLIKMEIKSPRKGVSHGAELRVSSRPRGRMLFQAAWGVRGREEIRYMDLLS